MIRERPWYRRGPVVALFSLALFVSACTGEGSATRDEPRSQPAVRADRPVFTPPTLRAAPSFDSWFESACALPEAEVQRIRRGHFPGRSPDLYMVPREPNFFGGFTSTSHSGPWEYLQRIPLLFYGPGFFRTSGSIQRPDTTLADIAPTLAELTDTELSDRAVGHPVQEALGDSSDRAPKLIVVVIWDGGGWNVLETWPRSWPFLKRLMDRGTSVTNATVGSSPSVTPAVHATIGTGAFPKQHGVVDMHLRTEEDEMVRSFVSGSPQFINLPTYGDLHDLDTDNQAEIGMFAYHEFNMGMMGHGSFLPGGDRDIQIISPSAPTVEFTATEEYFSLPDYLDDIGGFERLKREVDGRDGKIDGEWRGRSLDDLHDVRHSPVWVQFQTKLIKEVIEREGFGDDDIPDLLFVNYKQIDDAGHDWNMLNPEMKDVIEETDNELRNLVRFLDRQVGEQEWAMALTADHGQAPDALRARAWPIGISILATDLGEHFGVPKEDLIDETRPTGLWLNDEGLATHGITAGEIADFIIDYRIEDNTTESKTLPPEYDTRRREPVFSSAFPSTEMGRVWNCTQRRQGE